MSMSVNVRKRGSAFLLEEPAVSRMAFDKERISGGAAAIFASGIPSSSLSNKLASLPPTRAQHAQGKPAAELGRSHITYATEKKRQKLSTISEVAACDDAGDARSAVATSSSMPIGPTINTGRKQEQRESKASKQVPMNEGGPAPWGSGGWLGLSRRVGSGGSSAGRNSEEAQGRWTLRRTERVCPRYVTCSTGGVVRSGAVTFFNLEVWQAIVMLRLIAATLDMHSVMLRLGSRRRAAGLSYLPHSRSLLT